VAIRKLPDVARGAELVLQHDLLGYNTNPLGLYARYQFVATETAAVFWRETALALLLSVLLIRLALACGDRLQRIQR